MQYVVKSTDKRRVNSSHRTDPAITYWYNNYIFLWKRTRNLSFGKTATIPHDVYHKITKWREQFNVEVRIALALEVGYRHLMDSAYLCCRTSYENLWFGNIYKRRKLRDDKIGVRSYTNITLSVEHPNMWRIRDAFSAHFFIKLSTRLSSIALNIVHRRLVSLLRYQ